MTENESTRQTKPFHLLHADLVYLVDEKAQKAGPLDKFLPDENPPPYALVMVDDASRWVFVQPMFKANAENLLKAFINIESQCRSMLMKMLNDPDRPDKIHGFDEEAVYNPKISIIKHIHSDEGSIFRSTFGS